MPLSTRTSRRRKAVAATFALTLSLSCLASGAYADGLQPPPFPPPGGIELDPEGRPIGEGTEPVPEEPEVPEVVEPELPTAPELPRLPDYPKSTDSYNPFSGVADIVHGALDLGFGFFKPPAPRNAPPPPPLRPLPNTNWGPVADDDTPAQADAWALRVRGGNRDARLAEAHLPPLPDAPAAVTGAGKPVELGKAYSFGSLHRLSSRTWMKDGSVHAEAKLGRVELGLPYLKAAGKPVDTKRLPVELELRDAVTTAVGHADRAAEFRTEVKGGGVKSFGRELLAFDGPLKPNTSLRIPADKKLPPWGLVTLNEQISTDAQGHPTAGKDGRYAPEPASTSGYANTAHLTLLFPEAVDMTVGHAAVLHRGPGGDAQ
ncbi:hypothetical protein H9Y04_17205 [Streptomyces sp. TRM66268-LWL]|uniref:Uncharacterized protein n=1 Tax=Streptomyces polyasparticus TaxID=2767826 RepID=A0ABR7SFM1_9ACTN|nr:hypothetical protein [Streptomyces polyasparticus]MBC9714301.1 hypothetical protein [Streptomyces polyasparticus]